jgi:lysozyme family protein
MRHERFDIGLAFVLAEEGGYVNHPNDPGGETNFGISKRKFPDVDIKSLTRDGAAAIYRARYWNEFRCGELPPGLDFAMFDAAVQHLPGTAVGLIQKAVRVPADGKLGPQTIAAANRAPRDQALNAYFAERAQFYMDLITADSRKAVFRTGWFRRLFRLQAYILTTMPREAA